MDIELALALLVIAFYAGWKISQAWHINSFREILNDLNISPQRLHELMEEKGIEREAPLLNAEEDDGSHLPVLEVVVEQQPEGLFAYRKDNKLFIAMGKDRDTLMQAMIDNLSNVRVVIAKEDGADLISSVDKTNPI